MTRWRLPVHGGRRYSDPSRIVLSLPSAVPPMLAAAAVSGYNVAVNFSGGSDYVTLIPQWSNDAGVTWNSLGSDLVSPLNFTGLAAGSYLIRVLPNGNTSNPSNVIAATVLAPEAVLPIAPLITTSRINSTTIRFTFTGGSGATAWTGYYRAPGGVGSYIPVTLLVGQAFYDISVISGSSADVYIVATNSAGSVTSPTSSVSALTLVASLKGVWQYPSNTYEKRVMDMVLTHPRPDTETTTYERHRNAYPGLLYEIPVVIQGGAFPFRFELVGTEGVNFPTGMTVGQTYGTTASPNADYGVIKWQVPVGADGQSWTIKVRAYDQDYGRASGASALVEVTYTLSVNRTNFIFVSPAGAGSQNGTLGNEIAGLGAWYSGYNTASAYKNKVLVYRAGTYTFPSNWNSIWGQHHPVVHIAYPGETPTINHASVNNMNWIFGASSGGMFVDRLRFTNQLGHSIAYESSQSRVGVWRCKWVNARTNGLSNRSCFHTVGLGSSASRQHIFLLSCEADDLGPELYLTDLYSNTYCVVEDNEIKNTDNTGGTNSLIYPKGMMKYTSIRRNRATNNMSQNGAGAVIGIPVGLDGGNLSVLDGYEYIEICYNDIKLNTGRAFEFGRASSGASTKCWSYRNTFKGDIRLFDTADGKVLTVNRDIWVGTIYKDDNGTPITNSILATSITGLLDSSNLLTGTNRSEFVTRRGHELLRPGKLPTNYITPTRIPLTIINPAPAAQLGVKSRYLWAHGAFDYEVPLSIMGGRPPFVFELVTAPAGMTIERVAPSWNPECYSWGVIRWPAASVASSVGAQVVTMRVTDQDDTQATVTWNVTRDDSKFIFVDAVSGSDSNTGTRTSPYKTFSGWYKGDHFNTAHQNQIAVYRAGTYSAAAAMDPTRGFRFSSNSKPTGHISWPGEAVIWDFAGAGNINTFSTNTDWFFDGIQFTNGASHYHSEANDNRSVFWRTKHKGLHAPTGQNDNQGCMSYGWSSGHFRMSFIDIVLENISNSAGENNAVGIEFYAGDLIAIDGVTGINYDGSEFIFIKQDNGLATITNVSVYEPGVSEPGRSAFLLSNSHRIGAEGSIFAASYKIVQARHSRGYKSADTSLFYYNGSDTTETGRTYGDRLSIVGKTVMLEVAGATYAEGHITDSIIVNNEVPVIHSGFTQSGNLTYTRSANPMDSQGRILNSNRGLKGFELHIPA